MKKIFAVIDRIAKGPDIHSGPIIKTLKNYITLPPLSFPIIPISDEFRLNLITTMI